jgi:hypothetical protein
MEYPTPKRIKAAAQTAQRYKDAGLDLEREIYLATRQMNKFKSERIRAGYQADIDALKAVLHDNTVAA